MGNEVQKQARVWVIVVAAGQSQRMGDDNPTPKQWRPLGGKNFIERACDSFARVHQSLPVSGLVLVVEQNRVADALRIGETLPFPCGAVSGGATRADSVWDGIKAIGTEADIVVVHDAARPFWPVEQFGELMAALEHHDAVTFGRPLRDTLWRTRDQDHYDIVVRDGLHAIETPQAMRYDTLKRAHIWADSEGLVPTDDAGLVIEGGGTVGVIISRTRNFKITDVADWRMAQRIVAGEDG